MAQKRTFYKVVDKETRYGSNVLMWLDYFAGVCPKQDLNNFINENPWVLKYLRRYEDGAIVRAAKGSVGLFVFDSRHAAQLCMPRYRKRKGIVLAVEGYGYLEEALIISGCANLLKLKEVGWVGSAWMNPPRDTIFLRKLRVLGEV
jgi:hypothetical protein